MAIPHEAIVGMHERQRHARVNDRETGRGRAGVDNNIPTWQPRRTECNQLLEKRGGNHEGSKTRRKAGKYPCCDFSVLFVSPCLRGSAKSIGNFGGGWHYPMIARLE